MMERVIKHKHGVREGVRTLKARNTDLHKSRRIPLEVLFQRACRLGRVQDYDRRLVEE